jgi:hypothetical protein
MTKKEIIEATRNLYRHSSKEFLEKEIAHCKSVKEFHTVRIAILKKMIKEKENHGTEPRD